MKPRPVTNFTPASRFRPLIEAAIASGEDMSQQVLQLTYGDTMRLKRDPSVRDEDISFSDGVMTFLGVRVVEGAAASALADANTVITLPNPTESEVAAMAKGQKKSNKEIRKPKKEKPKLAPTAKSFTSPPPTQNNILIIQRSSVDGNAELTAGHMDDASLRPIISATPA